MRQPSILVAEDSVEDFETVQDAARRLALPHRIVHAATGQACLSWLDRVGESAEHSEGSDSAKSRTGREGPPQLLLLDLNLPGLDGREVLDHVRRSAELGALPVVVLSGSLNPRDVHFCYSHGANAYHVKPVDHALHLKALNSILSYWLHSVARPA